MSFDPDLIERVERRNQELREECARDFVSGKLSRDDFCEEIWNEVEPIVKELLANS